MFKKFTTNFLKVFLVTILLFFILSVVIGVYFDGKNSYNQKNVIFVVDKGLTFKAVVYKLHKEHIIENPEIFINLSRLLKGYNPKVFTGEYLFTKNLSNYDILNKITSGDNFFRKVTFAEGLSTHSILKIIDNTYGLKDEIENRESIKEGSLLPETYLYSFGDSKNNIVARMQKSMTRVVDTLWENRDLTIPIKSKEQAIILASIIEKETSLESERRQVASVFSNRLDKGMKLQTDPTIIYSFAFGDVSLEREIRRSDINNKSPFNTYHIYGLPPTAISNPGINSIKAVLSPLKTDYLYFVATGNGGHNFAATLEEHNRNVANYRAALQRQSNSVITE